MVIQMVNQIKLYPFTGATERKMGSASFLYLYRHFDEHGPRGASCGHGKRATATIDFSISS
jgi:hypothetical protein